MNDSSDFDKHQKFLRHLAERRDALTRATGVYRNDSNYVGTLIRLIAHQQKGPSPRLPHLLSQGATTDLNYNEAVILAVALDIAPDMRNVFFQDIRQHNTLIHGEDSSFIRQWDNENARIDIDDLQKNLESFRMQAIEQAGRPLPGFLQAPITLDGSQDFAKCLDSYVAQKGEDIHEFLKLYMESRNFDVPKLRDEINGKAGSNAFIDIEFIRCWVSDKKSTKINDTDREKLTTRYGLNKQQKTKLDFINGNIHTLDSRQLIVKQAETKLAKAETDYQTNSVHTQKMLLAACNDNAALLKKELGQTVIAPALRQIIEDGDAEAALIETERKKIAVDTFSALMDASGQNAEQLTAYLNQDITSSTLRSWRKSGVIEFDFMTLIADRMASVFIPKDENLARRAANIMMGLPWSEPKKFNERMQYATEHKQSAMDFMDTFFYQERERIYELSKQPAKEAFRIFLSENLPAHLTLTRQQLCSFARRQDAPNTEIINHVAKRLGASTPEEMAAFRKLVFEYPMDKGQPEVDAALEELEAAGADKAKRKAAFYQFEQALKERDGLRPKGYRKELSEHIVAYAQAQQDKLLPPDGGIDAEGLSYTIANLVNKGGEATHIRAKPIAAYAFQENVDNRRERFENVCAPHRLQETEPGKGNRFTRDKSAFRPNWVYKSPPRRPKDGGTGKG